MSWLDELLNKIDLSEYFPKGKSTGTNQIIINCPYHDDKIASCSINTLTGVYYCHACGAKGNFISWAKDNKIDLNKIAKKHGINTDELTIDKKELKSYTSALLESDRHINWLKRERGLTLETVKKYNFGLKDKSILIPIYNINGELVNIRIYSPRAASGVKFQSWKAGLGNARLFPVENLFLNPIMINEGEMDCILANQLGYNSVTSTAGAKTFRKEWARYFDGKDVIICYDVDQPGVIGSKKVTEILQHHAASIKILNLPLDKDQFPTGDFTDYIVHAGGTKKKIDALIKNIQPLELKKATDKSSIEYISTNLRDAISPAFNNKFVKFKALVSGKNMQSYFIPQKVKAACGISAGAKICNMCPMAELNGNMNVDIEYIDRNILNFYECADKKQNDLIKEIAGIPKGCLVVNFENIESANLEEIFLSPEIEYAAPLLEEQGELYINRLGILIGQKIETNKAYEFGGMTCSHPKTQSITHLLYESKSSLTMLENYAFTTEKHKRMKEVFSAEKDIMKKMEDIYEDTIIHISGIKQRLDLFIAVMLTYCSPLHFNFEERMVHKGWLETLVLGDTRTGKTVMLRSLINYFKAGELLLGESASFAGLIGGLQQGAGNQWQLNWGRIPLNDRRIVIIDEMSGLQTWEIAKLSGIRSSGIAEITKIRTERTFARTRLLWLSNPRGSREEISRQLNSYSQGIRAVPELIGKPEDISRFDIVLLLSQDEISQDEITKPIHRPKEFKYKGDDFHDLIMWSWKFYPKHILFKKETETYINELAKKLGSKYDQSIPVVMASEQHIKLARLATATAAMVYSTEDGSNLLVKPEHAEFAYNFLNWIFDKAVCSYDEYSRLEKARYSLKNEEEVIKLLQRNKNSIDQLLDSEKLTQGDLTEIFDIERSEIRKTINNLITNRAMKRGTNGYIKTPAFIKFLRDNKNGKLTETLSKIPPTKIEEEELPDWMIDEGGTDDSAK